LVAESAGLVTVITKTYQNSIRLCTSGNNCMGEPLLLLLLMVVVVVVV